ncbi:DNA repair ATPase [Rufibacter latericius]|uniref:DNA repair ATPase n=1 Tax=Rufibacter latericius TaxID=2487040 RepID=A0A3M9MMV3_9BACT|nr:DNA repair ATPase [Rufibacter latericius]RNI25998.1 DNA repair ATPase [Rufibacter latericius]
MKGTRTRVVAVAWLLMFWGMATSALAQRATVEETDMEINGVSRKGQRLMIQLDSKVVEKAWPIYLKEKSGGVVKGPSMLPTAKAQAGKGIYTVEKGKIDTISGNALRIISKVEATPKGTLLWWSLDMGNAYLNKKVTPAEWARSAAFLQQFARNLYKQDVQLQITDAEKVVVNTQAKADLVVREANEIQTRISKNQQKKQELEAALAANAKELEQLNKEAEANLKLQAANKKEIESMRHAVEIVKAKMDKID